MTSTDSSVLTESAEGSLHAQASQQFARLGEMYHQHRNVNIIADTCADFAPGVVDLLGITVIPFSYTTPEGTFEDDGWQRISPHEFYEDMRAHPDFHYTTASVAPGVYYQYFEEAAQAGTPTIYYSFTAGLSSSFYAAEQAAEMIREKYPDFELYVLDNLCPSAAAQLLVIEAVRQAILGLTAEELYAWSLDARYYIQGYFTIENLDRLSKGGRIPPAAANIGGKLDIKPELTYDVTGALNLKSICRGRKKALKQLIAEFKENFCHDMMLPVAILSSDAEKDADWVETQLRKEKGLENLKIIRSAVGPTIGSHVGPGMVALVFWSTDRREKLSLTDRLAKKIRARSSENA